MAFSFRKFLKGINIVPKTPLTADSMGDIEVDSASGKLNYHNGTTESPMVTESHTATLTNKTLTSPTINNPTITGGTYTPATLTVPDNGFTIQDNVDTTKQAQFQASGISAATTRTYTLPDANTTIVGTDATQTLTNKTLVDSTTTIVDDGDNTKGFKVEVSGVSAGQTRTMTVPDADFTAVGTDTTQTLTNKTITIADNALTIQDNGDPTKQAQFQASGITAGQTRTYTLPDANTTVVGTDATQTLSNKTWADAPIFTQIATPAAPSAGTQRFYPKSDGNFYTLNSSGVEIPVGTSSGGSKNYLTTYKGNTGNGNFELNATTGWSLFNTTLTSLIPTGSISAGAASVTTFNTVSSSQLAGSYSLQTESAGAWSAGQGFISDAFTIDNEDKAKIMSFSFYYQVVSGTVVASGTSSNNFAVYIYDVTNSTWIQPAGVYGITQTSGAGYCTGSFQTSATGTQYRIAILAVNATSGAVTLYWDDFTVGPETCPIGAVVTDWQSFTPTGSWVANTTYTGYWRRVGDEMEVAVRVATSGAPTSATLTINLPSGYSIDTTKLTSTSAIDQILGHGATNDSATTPYFALALYNNATSVVMKNTDDAAAGVSYGGITQASPITFGAGDFVTAFFRVPISGWSSNVQTSNSTDTRVVACYAHRNGVAASLAPNNSTVQLLFNSTASPGFDTHGALDTTSSYYLIPVSGKYRVTVCASVSSTNVLANVYRAVILKGTSTFGSATAVGYGPTVTPTVTTATGVGVTALVDCSAGDRIFAGFFGAGNNSVSTLTMTVNAEFSYMAVERVSGPSVIAATELVEAKYTTVAAQSIAGTGTAVIVDFGTKVTDSHGAVTTGASWKFTAPVSGLYQVSSACVLASGGSWNVAEEFRLMLYKNGSLDSVLGNTFSQAIHTANMGAGGAATVRLNAGDYIDIRLQQDSGGSINMSNAAGRNYVSIARMGL